ncbi:Putative glycosyltransferase EpsE [Terrisporobacter petrolearius]|uniref:glycosyltransferase family 2 protein n=1 Tax=Terrisporobacter petrolearius TaxID=1460447 RepID=UPI003366579C
MNRPKVSIVMGIYNCESTVKESINSIINQTYDDWELIMCDDCSRDNTYKVAKKYAERYPDKIKLLKNENNMTLAPTLNKCMEYVTGEYIARQDGDDISDKNRIEKQVEFLEKNNDMSIVGTNMVSFDENGYHGVHSLGKILDRDYYLKRGVIFFHATILIRTEVMKKLNGYSTKWYAVQAEDYELWSRFIKEGFKGYNLQENLYYVRENRDTYKRKNIKRRLRGLVLKFKVNRRLNASILAYVYMLKDIIAIFIPRWIFVRYYRKKMDVFS